MSARVLGLVLLGLVAACQSEPPPTLVGHWGVPAGGAREGCTAGLSFDGEGRLIEWYSCSLPGEDTELQRDEMTYEATDEEFTATLVRSTCPDAVRTVKHAAYTIDETTLRLVGDFIPFYLRLGPAQDDQDAGQARLGCFLWAGGNNFIEHPLELIVSTDR